MNPRVPSTAEPRAASAADAEASVSLVSPVSFRVNGAPQQLQLDPRTSLLDALRAHLQLSGTKKGCDHGTPAFAMARSAESTTMARR